MKSSCEKCAYIFDYIKPFCRLWGIITSIVLWGIGIEVTYHRYLWGIYVIIVAILLTFLETTWIVSNFLAVCIKDETNSFLQFWDIILWLDLWKKSLLYIVIALIMFVNPQRILMVIGGLVVVILSLVYLLDTYGLRLKSKNSLLHYQVHPYSRFEVVNNDEIDDALPSSLPNESVGDQQEILTI